MKAFPILAIAMAASSVCAFRLSGTILQEGTRLPLSGAKVTLTGRSDIPAALTDTEGRFLLVDGPVGTRASGRKELRASVHEGVLLVRGASAEPARLEAISPDGRIAATMAAVPDGSGEMRFALPRTGTRGISIFRFRQERTVAVWKGVSLAKTGTVLAATDAGIGARALVDGANDTLVVTKPGMKDMLLALPQGAGTSLASLESPVAMASTTRGRQRFIPEGRFLMGDADLAEARPPIRRTVKAFWIDTVLATRDEYRAMGFPQIAENGNFPGEGNWMRAVRYCNLRSAAEGLPAAYVLTADSASWSVQPGAVGYRLPTEAEWEYAARAGATTPWYWGDDSSAATVGKYASYTRTTKGNPIPVGTLLPNGFGLYDMSGNSWEWTEDMYGLYERDDVQPRPVKGTYGYERVMRGGMWASSVQELRSSYRKHDLPLYSPYAGVRCVRTAFPDTATPAWRSFPTERGQRRIPGGRFQMGDTAQPIALPLHDAAVGDLWVDTALVTKTDFVQLTGLPSYVDSGKPADVSWHKAVRYCNARSKRDGFDTAYALGSDSSTWSVDTSKNGYRLPTEAEWEYLARGGTATGWWWGNDSSWDVMSQRAWWKGNSVGASQPVAQKLPNPFGLYDMAGNHSQWTEDVYGAYKADGSKPDPEVFEFGIHRVYRGGAWFNGAQFLRSGYRQHDMPLASGYIGFRCVRTAR